MSKVENKLVNQMAKIDVKLNKNDAQMAKNIEQINKKFDSFQNTVVVLTETIKKCGNQSLRKRSRNISR